jgi:hypothetical protein
MKQSYIDIEDVNNRKPELKLMEFTIKAQETVIKVFTEKKEEIRKTLTETEFREWKSESQK